MNIQEIKELLSRATLEELTELRNLFWDRELELDSASGALDALWDAREMTPQEALKTGLEAATKSAKHLEAIWIEREGDERMKAPMSQQTNEPIASTLISEAIKQCRLELQWEFALVKQLGAGPMTKAEAEEYLANELKEQP